MTRNAPPAGVPSPLRLLVSVVLAIFTSELVIMLGFAMLAPALPPWEEAFIDAAILSAVLFPVLSLAIFRPLAESVRLHEQAEAELRTMRDHLEQRVVERTVALERYNREVGLLAETSHLLQACGTPQEVSLIVARAARQLFSGTRGALFVYSASRDDLEALDAWGEEGEAWEGRVFAPDECWALRRGGVYQLDDLTGGITCAHVRAPMPARYLCAPLSAHGEVMGVLHLQAGTCVFPPVPTAPLDERLAMTLAEHAALALMNLRLREKLRDQSIRDPLTGLFNRRYMEETLDREILRAGRDQRALGVVMLDIDHFKLFNDTHGHEAGDVLLREVGALLRSRLRATDIACRYGGEEFLLILLGAAAEGLTERLEALRVAVRQLNVRHNDALLGAVTASMGVATFPEHGMTGTALLRAADAALYRAKGEGRNRIVVADASPHVA